MMIMQQMKKKTKKNIWISPFLSPPSLQTKFPFPYPLPKFDWTRADDADGADDDSMHHKFFTDE